MKCRDVVDGKCTNKIVNELNPQEDRPLKCSGRFSNEVIGCYNPNKKLRTQDINNSIGDFIDEIRGEPVTIHDAGMLFPRTQKTFGVKG